MLVVDVISLQEIEPLKTKVICRLGWDQELKSIVILKGKRVGKQILTERYLDKRWPEKFQYIEASQGEDFIRNLCWAICESRCWATIPHEGSIISE